MNRRNYISILLLGIVPSTGCVASDSQPNQVAVWIDNQSGSAKTGEVEWTETGTNEQLLAADFDLEPDEEESFYAKPITEDGEYTVAIGVGDTREETSINGGDLREIDATIQSDSRIQIERIST